ncbi:hypothetical protein [Streptomyces sp. NPDC004296]|uniref:hypothetical protein n=1 Tax=Streptomyces sp. NPDC004296 TaxID=3364697 RepID=UPI0036C606B2
MSSKTMWQGWWSPFSLVLLTPITLISNLISLRGINKLGAPVPGQPGVALVPGKRVLRRTSSLAALLPLIWAIWIVPHIISAIVS